MAVDYYPQKSAEDLVFLLEQLQKRQTEGVTFFTTSLGMQTQKSFQGSGRVEVEIRRVLYSLHLKDPFSFPNDPYAQRIRRTRVRYV